MQKNTSLFYEIARSVANLEAFLYCKFGKYYIRRGEKSVQITKRQYSLILNYVKIQSGLQAEPENLATANGAGIGGAARCVQ